LPIVYEKAVTTVLWCFQGLRCAVVAKIDQGTIRH
jgi:hypothetical protein